MGDCRCTPAVEAMWRGMLLSTWRRTDPECPEHGYDAAIRRLEAMERQPFSLEALGTIGRSLTMLRERREAARRG